MTTILDLADAIIDNTNGVVYLIHFNKPLHRATCGPTHVIMPATPGAPVPGDPDNCSCPE